MPAPEPDWCVKTDHDDSAIGMHTSEMLRVGDRHQGRGEVGVYLIRGGDGPTWVAVNTAHGTSCTAEVSVRDAVQLRDHLDALLELAGREDLNDRGHRVRRR